jgi:glycosyltransferase involved in cell wall biosynthesis
LDVLTLVDFYLPGFKSGGPLRTIANMVERLEGRHRFFIVTRDRDFKDREPYPGITPGSWKSVGRAQVIYLSPDQLTLQSLRSVLALSRCDLLYCNSLFSPAFTVKPLWLRRTGRLPWVPAVVAPRGECSPAALAIKRTKKRVAFHAARAVGLYRGVVWQASSPAEEADIRRLFGEKARIVVAPDITSLGDRHGEVPRRSPKVPGRLRVVFVSRVSRMKNLKLALELLEGLGGDVEFDIYGPIDDKVYWPECEETARRVSASVRVRYHGGLPHEDVPRVLAERDLFFLPTQGENFGHAILEALLAGCPVLISDRTPWRGLEEKGVGWDVPLEDTSRFRDMLRQCLKMDAPTHEAWSRRAREFGLSRRSDDAAVERNAQLLEVAAREGRGR